MRKKESLIKEENGSYSIEAAILLPICISFILIFVYILQMICTRINVNNKLYNAVSELSIYESKSYEINNNFIKKLCDKIENDGLNAMEGKAIFSGYCDDKINISANYKYSIPFIGFDVIQYDIIQKCYLKPFIGNNKLKEDSQIVFVTENGKVYHNFTDCTYLRILTQKIKYKELLQMGKKYTPCKFCINKNVEEDEYVFITEYGGVYHSKDSCSYIYRNVISIPLSQIEGMTQCKKCKDKSINKEGD